MTLLFTIPKTVPCSSKTVRLSVLLAGVIKAARSVLLQ